ncbi:MAG: class I SAM-dependent methyltransferase [Nitrospirae bacterium]|nr:class I SAM-dependent methyltransferase [Nitrospirota bacterium]
MEIPKSNGREFTPNLEEITKKPLSVKVSGFITRFKRHILKMQVDDDNWETYSKAYGPENEAESFYYTFDLGKIDHKIIEGNIYILGDCKPLQFSNRAIIEAVINLPDIFSIAEVGAGNGKLIVNIKRILGSKIGYSASDIAQCQLDLFKQTFPKDFDEIRPYVLDITKEPLPLKEKTDVVFAATVLMHIKRDIEYNKALLNLLFSANKFVVIIDNWKSHDYYEDISNIITNTPRLSIATIYKYDSGSNICIIVALAGDKLPSRYTEMHNGAELIKYFT